MTDRKDYFKTFCMISKAFGSTLNRDELLDLIVQSAIDTMNGKAACIFLADPQKEDMFSPAYQKGLSDNYLHSDPYRGKAMVDELVKKGYLVFDDIASDPRVENKEAKKSEGIASILVVPVMVEAKPIGVLSLYTAEAREFSEDEIEFLSALAEQGGIAIQNARLVERMRKNALLFHDLADSINSSLDIQKILHILTADLAETFGMKGVNIRLLNKDSGTLDLVATYGLSEDFLNKGPVSKDKSVSGALDGETVVIQNAQTDRRVQYQEAMKKEGIVSMLCVPLRVGEEVIGVMRLCSETERDFPEDMIILVEALASQGGIAIQNASMYLSLQEDKKDLEQDVFSHRMWF
ncbi:MAG: GAF domain-containing protein [Desulfococcaceae bacterium]